MVSSNLGWHLSLPHDYKMVVLLADIEGFSYKEIAEILDCPVGTVMSRLYRGRKMLERTLLEYARKYGYIRGTAEPAKMRSRKDETKGRKKKDAEPGDETEIQEPEADEEETPATIEPAPARPEPTVVVSPTIVRRPEPVPSVQSTRRVTEDETFTIRENEFMQYVTKRVSPVLPPQAKNAGITGPVMVRVYLSPDGQLSKAEVIEGEMLLREAALIALRQK